jgi:hypothetical protein
VKSRLPAQLCLGLQPVTRVTPSVFKICLDELESQALQHYILSECMQMFQIIVYEDPIPTRLFLNDHSARTAVPAWRYDSSRQAFSEASQRMQILVLLPTRKFPLRPSYVPGARRGSNRIPPIALATYRASEGLDSMARDVKETRRQFLQAGGGPGMWWESQPGLCS